METHLPPSDDNPLTQHGQPSDTDTAQQPRSTRRSHAILCLFSRSRSPSLLPCAPGKKDTGTLWDQERDELAVRILLEEGKLNLALRILHKYRTALRDSDKFTAAIKITSEKFNSDMVTVTDRCRVFEQSVGILLKFAFSHVEALQIMDLPEFIQHCVEVVAESECSTRPSASPLEIDKLQETLVLHYLAGLAGAMEDMDEDRVMDLVQEHNLLPLIISHLTKHYTWYKLDALLDACKFLNGALASEAYQADRTKFISDKKTIQELCSLKGLFLSEMLTPAIGVKKKDVQMLLDELAKFERTPGVVVSKDTVPLKERLDKWKMAELKEKAAASAAAATAQATAAAAASAAPMATPKK
jgi:hypothetical protein